MEEKQILANFWKERGIKKELIDAFLRIPREFFVAPEFFKQAYDDRPLPTSRGQSLSQPTTVMIMTQALEVMPGQNILEIGSGVGYQASILSKLVGHGRIITTEIMPELAKIARNNVHQLGCLNVEVKETDGSRGVPEEAPFDRVMITCACPKIPELIIDQVKDGGIIVAPVGDLEEQVMVKAVKKGRRLEFEFLGLFAFVPLQGKYGFDV